MSIWPFAAKTDKRLIPNKESQIVISRPQALIQMMYWLASVPDPDTLLQRVGIQRSQLRVLETDDEISQALDTRRDALTTTPWRIEPFNTRASRFLMDELTPHIQTLLNIFFNAVPYGYSVAQINYRVRGDGRIGIGRAWECPFEWFTPTFIGGLLANTTLYAQDEQGRTVMVATVNDSVLEKSPGMYFHTVRNGSYRNPYGEALLSRLWFPITWRLAGWQLWMNFLETFGQPIIVGQTINYEAFVEAMKAQGVRSAIGFQASDQDTKITTIQASQSGEFSRLDDAVTQRIQKLILGQTLTSQMSASGGSYAAAEVHNEIRHDKRNADIRLATKTMQKVVDTLVALNRLNGSFEFILSDDTGLEMVRAERDAALLPVLMQSGVNLTREYFINKFDYDEGDLTETAQPEPVPAAAPPGPGTADQATADGQDSTPANPNMKAPSAALFADQSAVADPTPVTDYTDRLQQDASAPLQAILKQVGATVEKSKNLQALRDELLALYGNLETDKLTQVMQMGYAAAHLAGQYEAKRGE
jgi:phage gp29-like protein